MSSLSAGTSKQRCSYTIPVPKNVLGTPRLAETPVVKLGEEEIRGSEAHVNKYNSSIVPIANRIARLATTDESVAQIPVRVSFAAMSVCYLARDSVS